MTDHQGSTDKAAIDHEARSMARHVLDRQDAHEKFCEDRARRSEAFETEMKRNIARILRRMDEAVREHIKMQTRQNIIWVVMIFVLGLSVEYFMK